MKLMYPSLPLQFSFVLSRSFPLEFPNVNVNYRGWPVIVIDD